MFFTYFYVSITFNPEERADDMKKYGGFIPGIRPGRPTAEYLSLRAVPDHASRCRSTWASSPCCRTSSSASPSRAQNQNFPFGGTAVLIMVGVGLETVKQIETQLNQRNYEGFLK